jgi:hypothetical protein
VSGRIGQGHQVTLDLIADVEPADVVAERQHRRCVEHLGHPVERLGIVAVAAGDGALLGAIGVTQVEADQESVELRLGERERALVLDRVLGRQHELRQDAGQALHET